MASSPSSPTRADARAQGGSAPALRPLGVTAGLAVVAAVGWVVVIFRRDTGMDMGGADASAFLTFWVAMVAAMMLPTIQPMIATYRALFRNDPARIRRSRLAIFFVPYAALWGVTGTGAFALWSTGRDHPAVAGALVATAGLYQLGPIKTRCLRWCRSPFSFLMHFRGDARSVRGALALGTQHGAVCFGCCAGLMVGLTGAGVMAISWLVALGLLMVLEKTHRAGPALARASGMVLLALGAATAVSPLERLASETTGLAAVAALGVTALATGRFHTT